MRKSWKFLNVRFELYPRHKFGIVDNSFYEDLEDTPIG